MASSQPMKKRSSVWLIAALLASVRSGSHWVSTRPRSSTSMRSTPTRLRPCAPSASPSKVLTWPFSRGVVLAIRRKPRAPRAKKSTSLMAYTPALEPGLAARPVPKSYDHSHRSASNLCQRLASSATGPSPTVSSSRSWAMVCASSSKLAHCSHFQPPPSSLSPLSLGRCSCWHTEQKSPNPCPLGSKTFFHFLLARSAKRRRFCRAIDSIRAREAQSAKAPLPTSWRSSGSQARQTAISPSNSRSIRLSSFRPSFATVSPAPGWASSIKFPPAA